MIPYFFASASLITIASPPAFALSWIDYAIGSSIPLRFSEINSGSKLIPPLLVGVAAVVGLFALNPVVFPFVAEADGVLVFAVVGLPAPKPYGVLFAAGVVGTPLALFGTPLALVGSPLALFGIALGLFVIFLALFGIPFGSFAVVAVSIGIFILGFSRKSTCTPPFTVGVLVGRLTAIPIFFASTRET